MPAADCESIQIRQRAKATLAILIAGALITVARVHTPALPAIYTLQSSLHKTHESSNAAKAPGTIRVSVTGDVERAGTIEFIEGTTLKGLLEAVRPKPTAYTTHADFSYVLQDGDEIHVPTRAGASRGRILLSDETLLRIRILSHKKIAAAESSAPGLNLNLATLQELQTLPRIGPETARRIIEAREERGRFLKKEDLLRIRGIGKKTYKWLEPLVTVE